MQQFKKGYTTIVSQAKTNVPGFAGDYSKFMDRHLSIKNKIDAVRSRIHEINSSANKQSETDQTTCDNATYESLIKFMTR